LYAEIVSDIDFKLFGKIVLEKGIYLLKLFNVYTFRETWICPACDGSCTCPRCKKKSKFETEKSELSSDEPDSSDMTKEINFISHFTSLPTEPNKFALGETTQKLIAEQLHGLMNWEKRVEENIDQMQKMLEIMKKEKEEVKQEKLKLMSFLKESS
jgi:hypothetical protein